MNNLGYLVAAYAVVWVSIFFYVWRMDRHYKSLGQEVERLESRLSETEGPK